MAIEPASIVFSLRSKLILAFVGVVVVALVIAGSIFVLVRRGEQEQQELNQVIAASPAIYAVFSVLEERRATPLVLREFVDSAAESFDVRVLLVDRHDALVVADSSDSLMGERLDLPDEVMVSQHRRGQRPYISWEPDRGSPGSDLILVSASVGRQLSPFTPSPDERYQLLLAVSQGTIRGAWRGLLPAMGVAALISIPAAVALAIVVARYITRPLQQLTLATQQMAEGTFDVDVSIERRDEVGRLAQSFKMMAQRVGEAHAETRALVASVSHDLKTPLTSILGFAQALRDDGGDAEARRMGGVIHDEATRLTTRLNDLLYLSEIESGKALLERAQIDVRKLIEGIIGRLGNGSEEREVQLSTELAEGLIVSADGPKLERAVENLIENARKYTPEGGEFRIRSAESAGSVLIEVANAAPDMNADELPRLFERFYRRDRARGASTGSGLGLPIARDLIELHGGTLEASLSGGEIKFTILFPRGD
ncbi:MAG: HAMP domain-containing histidine kinase [Chloroflexi bacterium]|nr:HAMP domain-containing histidine kinase [Chloroflexota bacterium]